MHTHTNSSYVHTYTHIHIHVYKHDNNALHGLGRRPQPLCSTCHVPKHLVHVSKCFMLQLFEKLICADGVYVVLPADIYIYTHIYIYIYTYTHTHIAKIRYRSVECQCGYVWNKEKDIASQCGCVCNKDRTYTASHVSAVVSKHHTFMLYNTSCHMSAMVSKHHRFIFYNTHGP